MTEMTHEKEGTDLMHLDRGTWCLATADVPRVAQLLRDTTPSTTAPLDMASESRHFRRKYPLDDEVLHSVDRRVQQGRGPVFKSACRLINPFELRGASGGVGRDCPKVLEVLAAGQVRGVRRALVVGETQGAATQAVLAHCAREAQLEELFVFVHQERPEAEEEENTPAPKSPFHAELEARLSTDFEGVAALVNGDGFESADRGEFIELVQEHGDDEAGASTLALCIGSCEEEEGLNLRAHFTLAQVLVALRAVPAVGTTTFVLRTLDLTNRVLRELLGALRGLGGTAGCVVKPPSSRVANQECFVVLRGVRKPLETELEALERWSVALIEDDQAELLGVPRAPDKADWGPVLAYVAHRAEHERQAWLRRALEVTSAVVGFRPMVRRQHLRALESSCNESDPRVRVARDVDAHPLYGAGVGGWAWGQGWLRA